MASRSKKPAVRNGYPGVGRLRGRIQVISLTEKDRNAIATLFLTGYNKGFLAREAQEDRIIWEITMHKDE